jgi:hypothetical protein
MHSSLLAPLMALVLWTFVMCAWMYATRIPAMMRLKVAYDPRRPVAEFQAQLPPAVRWKADNYNHLMEQPTLFYAVALTLAFLGADGGFNAALAWAYVGVRVVHSLVQAMVNIILLRFAIFMIGTLVLLLLSLRAAWVVFA